MIQKLYNSLIRPILPFKISVHNGVAVRDTIRLFDSTDEFPEYEEALISSIRTHIHEKDRVTIVGGGLGVSTVAAVEATGRKGAVVTFEASENQNRIIRNTVNLNRVSDVVELHHAIVGFYSEYSSESFGSTGNADEVNPSSLPKTDALILDCEGAEREIIKNLSDPPRIIIVETHGFLDSTEEEVRDILLDMGYEIVDRDVEVEAKGIIVLTAKYNY